MNSGGWASNSQLAAKRKRVMLTFGRLPCYLPGTPRGVSRAVRARAHESPMLQRGHGPTWLSGSVVPLGGQPGRCHAPQRQKPRTLTLEGRSFFYALYFLLQPCILFVQKTEFIARRRANALSTDAILHLSHAMH
jgi:hypothetical protein